MKNLRWKKGWGALFCLFSVFLTLRLKENYFKSKKEYRYYDGDVGNVESRPVVEVPGVPVDKVDDCETSEKAVEKVAESTGYDESVDYFHESRFRISQKKIDDSESH